MGLFIRMVKLHTDTIKVVLRLFERLDCSWFGGIGWVGFEAFGL